MSEIEVTIDNRYLKRKSSNAVGKSILKTLTEPITNSDDSYRILSAKGEGGKTDIGSITIQVNRKSRLVRIIDNAEGMSKSDLEKKFKVYGAEKSGAYEGYAVRGLFGQGISDVLFYHSEGIIKTIKNGEASTCEFYERDDKRFINVNAVPGDATKTAQKWELNSTRGTIVEFVADEDAHLYEFENLANRLSVFYMLRLINSNDTRHVLLQYTDLKGRMRQSAVRYKFPEGEPVDHQTFSMQFEDYAPVEIEANLYRSKEALAVAGDERENGLLVHDEEETIYDQTFFGLDNFPGTDKYYGFLKLKGAREIIKDKINKKKNPEEVLLDTRDGFNTQHEFYKQLEAIVKKWLYPIISKGRNHVDEGGLSEAVQEKQKLAFDELNKLYSQLTGEDAYGTIRVVSDKRPAGGLEFARSQMAVTVNKKYSMQLAIDTRIIKPGSIVKITAFRKNIGFTPDSIKVEDPGDSNDDILIKTITILGNEVGVVDTLEATHEQRKSSVVVSVIKEGIFYPGNGLEFHPDYTRIVANRESKLILYIDARLIKNGDKIVFTSSNEHIKLKKTKVTLAVGHHRNSIVARVPVIFSGEQIGESGIIEATCKEYRAQARIDVVDRIPKKPSSLSGKFRGWSFDEKVTMPFQAFYDHHPESPTCGFILINPNHPINIRYFGENPRKSEVVKSQTGQLYLAEIILSESLNVAIPEAMQKGVLPKRSDYDLLYYIAQKKWEYGAAIYKHFVEEKESLVIEREKQLKALTADQVVSDKDITDGMEEREGLMVEMRFGLNDQYPHTLEEIAKKYSITRERVRQIINNALAKKYGKDEEVAGKEKGEEKHDYIKEQEAHMSSAVDSIIQKTAKLYGVSEDDLVQRGRWAEVVKARQLAMYLMREGMELSFPSIGRTFKRDHTTVIYAFEKISKDLKRDGKLKARIEKIRKEIEV